eukprot:1376212-Rhodomonas_salina.3
MRVVVPEGFFLFKTAATASNRCNAVHNRALCGETEFEKKGLCSFRTVSEGVVWEWDVWERNENRGFKGGLKGLTEAVWRLASAVQRRSACCWWPWSVSRGSCASSRSRLLYTSDFSANLP